MNISRFKRKATDFIQTILINSQKTNQALMALDIKSIYEEIKQSIDKAPTLKGFSVYSQNDEDGILEDIFNRLNISQPNFFEFGVAPQENNSNYLILKGSKGCWIDKGLANLKKEIPKNTKLRIFDEFVTLENIVQIVEEGCRFLAIPAKGIDLISLDLDGNDYYFIDQIVSSGIFPKVFCLEYNASFRPPLDIKIRYNADHQWAGDDYFGCSLNAYCNLLAPYYTLVACNLAGSNCFFVHNELSNNFMKYSIEELYQPPRYHLSPFTKGHPPGIRYVLERIADDQPL